MRKKDYRLYSLFDTHKAQDKKKVFPMANLRCGWPVAKQIENALNYAYENELPDYRDLPIAPYGRARKEDLWNT